MDEKVLKVEDKQQHSDENKKYSMSKQDSNTALRLID